LKLSRKWGTPLFLNQKQEKAPFGLRCMAGIRNRRQKHESQDQTGNHKQDSLHQPVSGFQVAISFSDE
jgi:hypothetical protein